MAIGSRKTVGEIEALPEFDDFDLLPDDETLRLIERLKMQALEHEPIDSDKVRVRE